MAEGGGHFTSFNIKFVPSAIIKAIAGEPRALEKPLGIPCPAFRVDPAGTGYSRWRDAHGVQVGQPHHVGVANEPWFQGQLGLDPGLQLCSFPGLLDGIIHERGCLRGLDRVTDGEPLRLGRRRNFGLLTEKEVLFHPCFSRPRATYHSWNRDQGCAGFACCLQQIPVVSED